jgi:hypothetical protein
LLFSGTSQASAMIAQICSGVNVAGVCLDAIGHAAAPPCR